MLQDERYSQIYELLQSRGNATVQLLAKNLYVSEATIRRDLEEMEKRGLVKRVWGGAMLPTGGKDIPDFVRLKTENEKKDRIAEIAAAFVGDSSTIFFDSSTTCRAMVPHLEEKKNLTVVTSSLIMSMELVLHTTASVNILGGQISEDYILTGHIAVETVKQFHTDIMFFSCSGISASSGITSIEPKVIEVCREMMRNTSMRVLLCDTSKVGKHSLLKLTDISAPDFVIMDAVPDDSKLVSLLGSWLITARTQLKR